MSKATGTTANQSAASQQAAASATPVTPVRSAKDAINAMYAEGSNTRLSDYLATSAKDIINASHSSSDEKSASSLHRGSSKRRINIAKPSASSIFRTAQAEETNIPEDVSHAMDPLAQRSAPATPRRRVQATQPAEPTVIKTSLKLGPKRNPLIMNRQASSPRTTPNRQINRQKGSTTLSQALANRGNQSTMRATEPIVATPIQPDVATQEAIRAMREAVRKNTAATNAASKTVKRPRMRPPQGLMQDIVRPGQPMPTPVQATPVRNNIPQDSVRHRFRAAPKGFTAAPQTQPTGYVQDFESMSATHATNPTTSKPPIEIYGLMDEEPTGKSNSIVVEDYVSSAGKNPTTGGTKAPDNNKYAIKGQSPFFLKTVNVEKRPLSGAVNNKKPPTDGTLYERPDTTPVGGKNVYTKKETKKVLPSKPTVIIPASRRSRTPLVVLLILTILLGAAVGAFAYLTFFQYME